MEALRVDGLAESYALLGAIPDAAREQLAGGIETIASDVLAAQRRDVAKRTGALAAGLSLDLQIDALRARVGLLGTAARSASAKRRALRQGRAVGRNYGDLYYGRFVEYGRREQVVNVRRGSNGRPYRMHVSALVARPFVHVDRPEIDVEQRLADFWSGVLAKAGAGA